MKIDTHTHIWDNLDFPNENNRYTPDYLFTQYDLETTMSNYDITKAVLVQPSFLGNDNSLITQTIAKNPKRYKGVIVLDNFDSFKDLKSVLRNYNSLGIKGIRFNLIAKKLPNLKEKKYEELFCILIELNWHVEIHANEDDICTLFKDFSNKKVKIVLDHFARPLQKQYSAKFVSLLNSGINFYVKLSGNYRFNNYTIDDYLYTLLLSLGKHKLLWGSDCPFTKFEDIWIYEYSIDLLMKNKLICALAETLDNNAKELFFRN